MLVCQTPNVYWNGVGESKLQETGMVLVCQTPNGNWNGAGVLSFKETRMVLMGIVLECQTSNKQEFVV